MVFFVASFFVAVTGTISLPSGTSETGINLRLASASGMPMIVMAIATALTKCAMASQMPNSITQMTLPISVNGWAPGFSTMVRPNGHSAYEPMRSAANPNGIVTIYRGLPYDLPFGVRMYETFYVSGVPASLVPADRRSAFFGNQLRSESSAQTLVHDLELGKISQ